MQLNIIENSIIGPQIGYSLFTLGDLLHNHQVSVFPGYDTTIKLQNKVLCLQRTVVTVAND